MVEREKRYRYLPQVILGNSGNGNGEHAEAPVTADAPCPCCGYITIPNGGDALAYICPVCLWEIDLFITSDDEPSDQNHGLTLMQARANYRTCGAVLPSLKKYGRVPREEEIPGAEPARDC